MNDALINEKSLLDRVYTCCALQNKFTRNPRCSSLLPCRTPIHFVTMRETVGLKKPRRSEKQKAVAANLRFYHRHKGTRQIALPDSAATALPLTDAQVASASSGPTHDALPSSSNPSQRDVDDATRTIALQADALRRAEVNRERLEDTIEAQRVELKALKREGKRLTAEIATINGRQSREERATLKAHRAEQAKNKRLQKELDAMGAEAERIRQNTIRKLAHEVMVLRRVAHNLDPTRLPESDVNAYMATYARVQEAIARLVVHLTGSDGVQTEACRASTWALVVAGCPLRDVSGIVRQISDIFGDPAAVPAVYTPFIAPSPTAASMGGIHVVDAATKRNSFVVME